jgi:hypothetical protein
MMAAAGPEALVTRSVCAKYGAVLADRSSYCLTFDKARCRLVAGFAPVGARSRATGVARLKTVFSGSVIRLR